MAAVLIVKGAGALIGAFARLAGAMGGGIGRAISRPILTALDDAPIGFVGFQRLDTEAVEAAAEFVAEEARARAPKDTGKMADSIHVSTDEVFRGGGGLRLKLFIGTERTGATARVKTGTRETLGIVGSERGYYPASIEFGYKHGKSGRHIRSRPFMRPALYENESRILQIMASKMKVGLLRFQIPSRSRLTVGISQTA